MNRAELRVPDSKHAKTRLSHDGVRIAVRFAYEWHDDSGSWFRAYGNENWEFNAAGLMTRRHASINDLPIRDSERKYHWPLGRRPDDHPGLGDLGL
jgi:nuclear transport factor 2 (NTF2) superfamily protein